MVKDIRFGHAARLVSNYFFVFIFVLAVVLSARAQSPTENQPPAEAQPPATDATQSRLMRARSLAATGNFPAATSELEAVRAAARDDSVRDVTRVLLMSVHLRQGNYTRAQEILDEAFKARGAGNESTTNVYFALTGQMLRGIRLRLDRYREFGLDATAGDLPAEAGTDLDRIKQLLEHLVEQAKAIREASDKSPDSTALLEDAASIRLVLARNGRERTQWQREVAEARQRLAASETRIASTGRSGNAATLSASAEKIPATTATATASATSAPTSAPVPSTSPRTSSTSSGKDSVASSQSGVATTSAPPAAPPSASSSNTTASGGGGNATGGAPVSVGSLHEMATQKVAPTYPLVAKSARIAGVVTVFLVVDEKGTVESVQRTNGPAMLQQAAEDAARRWKFRPTEMNGQLVRVAGFISFNFSL